MFEGAPFKPFEHTMTFSAKCFFFQPLQKIHLMPIQDFFAQNMHVIKKKKKKKRQRESGLINKPQKAPGRIRKHHEGWGGQGSWV